MKILGIIAEYNPFHLGHKYHIEESKRLAKADYTLAIMSGSFVQRGEPALIDKFHRAESAILNGIDLVIELPFIYACQTAEIFSKASIQILNNLNCIDYISFGSEFDNISILKEISSVLICEPSEYKNHLKYNLEKAYSFPIARSRSLKAYFETRNTFLYENIEDILAGSNNILAIEYLKELIKLDSNIEAITIKRRGNNYSDRHLASEYSSATSIRENILGNNLKDIEKYMPDTSFSLVEDFYKKYKTFNSLENYYNYFNYKLVTDRDKINSTFDIGYDLGNRFYNNFGKASNLNELIDIMSSKNYTRTRIQRAIINFLLNNYSSSNLTKNNPNYIRILGSNKKGFEIINKIKKESDTIILNRFSDHYKNPELNSYIEFEKTVTDLYYLGLLNSPLNDMDYKTSPYIKK